MVNYAHYLHYGLERRLLETQVIILNSTMNIKHIN